MKLNMNPTAVRFLIAFTITMGAFGAYCTFLVPILETPIQKTAPLNTESSLEQESPYAQFFDEGAWERNPQAGHLLKSNNIVMFFKNLAMDESMKVKSEECTILVAPGETAFPMVKLGNKPFYPIKVSIHDGAEIQFSSDEGQLDPRPLGGRLLGAVTISYKMQIQGHWVDCFVKTSDLYCDMQSLQTSRPVRLMIGPFSVEGSQFKLLFEKSSNDQLLFSGIRSIQLGHLEHITLKINPILMQMMNLKMNPEIQERIRQMFGNKMEIPITLKCNGPMIYDVPSGIVKFTQNVVLSCDYPGAPPDRLTCGELELRLDSSLQEHLMLGDSKRLLPSGEAVDPEKNAVENGQTGNGTPGVSFASEETNASSPQKMEGIPLDSIHAKQNVSLNVPTLQCTAEAENLSFLLRNLQLKLSGNEQSTIRMRQNEFHAFELSYTFPPGNMQSLGTIESDQKGGWLKTSFEGEGTDPAQNLVLRWTGTLRGTPREKGRYDVKVTGQVVAFSEQFGEIQADAISARMRPRTPADAQSDRNIALALGESPGENASATGETKEGSLPNYLPEILRALGNVQLRVNQGGASLDASLTNIEIQFQKPSTLPPELQQIKKVKNRQISGGASPGMRGFEQNNNLMRAPEGPNARHFRLAAGDLKSQILLLPGKEGFFIREVTLEGTGQTPILLHEEDPMITSEQAIALQAHRIFLRDLHPETLQCEISGPDSYLAGLGIRLESSQMALNCAANRIDINGAGKMRVFSRQSAGTHLNYSTMTETVISWEKGLSFNGQKIEARDQVKVKMDSTSLCADLIYVDLREKILLSSPPRLSTADNLMALDIFQNISAEHNVQITHKNYTTTGTLSDIFLLSTHFLNFFPETMTVAVTGTGFLRLSHLGTPGNFMAQEEKPQETVFDATPGKENSGSGQEWFQILMEYDQGITGKLAEGEFSIKGNISALACPVPNSGYMIPETRIDPRKIPEKGFQFRCEEIFVNQIPTVQDSSFPMGDPNEKKVEIQARRNIHMENSTLSVEGSLLKYSQEKDTCSIEGEPNRPVYIVQQEFRGGRRNETKAGSVDINLKTMKFKAYNVTIDSAF